MLAWTAQSSFCANLTYVFSFIVVFLLAAGNLHVDLAVTSRAEQPLEEQQPTTQIELMTSCMSQLPATRRSQRVFRPLGVRHPHRQRRPAVARRPVSCHISHRLANWLLAPLRC